MTDRQETINQLQADLARIRRERTQLQERNEELAANVASSSTSVRRDQQKLPDPEKFNGNQFHLDSWLAKLKLKISADAHKFPTPEVELAYTYSLLTGHAARWTKQFMGKTDRIGDFATFETEIIKAYGDPSPAITV